MQVSAHSENDLETDSFKFANSLANNLRKWVPVVIYTSYANFNSPIKHTAISRNLHIYYVLGAFVPGIH